MDITNAASETKILYIVTILQLKENWFLSVGPAMRNIEFGCVFTLVERSISEKSLIVSGAVNITRSYVKKKDLVRFACKSSFYLMNPKTFTSKININIFFLNGCWKQDGGLNFFLKNSRWPPYSMAPLQWYLCSSHHQIAIFQPILMCYSFLEADNSCWKC
jgi:hypothetical protein